jgi:hypothetical protein
VKALLEMVVGFVLRRIVGPPGGRRRRARPTSARSPRAAKREPAARPAPPARRLGRPRGPLVGLMLFSLVVGAALMFFFEEWYTRLPAVLLLFTFVVSGVFVITGSGVLDDEE